MAIGYIICCCTVKCLYYEGAIARLQGWMGQEVPVTAPQDDKARVAPEAAPYSNPADVPSHPPRRPRGRPPSRRPLPQDAPQQGPLLGLSPAPSGSMGQVRSSICVSAIRCLMHFCPTCHLVYVVEQVCIHCQCRPLPPRQTHHARNRCGLFSGAQRVHGTAEIR